jgi:hypothetical protein
MAGYYEEQETSYQLPLLHHELSQGEPSVVVAPVPSYEFSGLRAQVEEVIDRGFSDLWLLLDGEEIERDFASGIWRDGRPFAMVTGDQISLLGPKFSAINALLSVGVSMT